jgi:hypothetical protein
MYGATNLVAVVTRAKKVKKRVPRVARISRVRAGRAFSWGAGMVLTGGNRDEGDLVFIFSDLVFHF